MRPCNDDRELRSSRVSRKVIENSGRQYHVVNIKDAAQIDEELLNWLTEAWELDG